MKRTTLAVTAALSLMAAPAVAQETQEPSSKSAPQTICKDFSKKKVAGTKGQTAFAGCVSGVKRQNADAAKERKQNPARSCKAVTPALSKRSAAEGQKSPYAACVSGYMKAQKQAAAAA